MQLPYHTDNAKVFIEIPVDENCNIAITLAMSDDNHAVVHIQLGHIIAIIKDENKAITKDTDLLTYCLATDLVHSAMINFMDNFVNHTLLSTTKAFDKLLEGK